MIKVSHIDKTYQGFDIDRKEGGIALWIKNLSRLTANRASPVQALKDVTFSVTQGEIFGIFGANGAGKTTLIKILSGLLLPDRGTVDIAGKTDIHEIKETISYISTNGWMGLEWQLTAYENLLLYGQLFGMSGATLRARCDAALHRLEMDDARNKAVSALSAGMRQKITLARGLLLNRPVLYLDEPTVSLDVQSSAHVRALMQEYAVKGTTILVTSHNPVDLGVCDRILFLHRGHLVGLGTMDELLAPLQGITALHVTGDVRERATAIETVKDDLLQMRGVRDVRLEPANGKRDNWRARIVIEQDAHPTGEIVDVFIRCDVPIVSLQMQPITLQEIYEHYVEQANVN
ncbi:MAG: ABC transporter ATP-binding protein [Anaerolineae bacterium]|nr:ABC transporter ATP-binding protein [Anaerolineae bacterium]